MQHASQHDRSLWSWRPLALALVLAPCLLALSGSAAHAGDSYYGADIRHPSSVGGYEGSHLSGHYHGSHGFYSYPGNFHEGFGPRNDYGHNGEARRHGAYADASGHSEGAFLVQRLFMGGGYTNPDHRLFHYRNCYGEH